MTPQNAVKVAVTAKEQLVDGIVLVTLAAPDGSSVLSYGIFDTHAAFRILGPIVGGASVSEQLYLPERSFETLRYDPRVSPLYSTES